MSAGAIGRLGILGLTLLVASVAPAQAQGVGGAINSPGPNATVMQPFSITGWALHGPGAGTGIDAVHIYGCTTVCTFWGAATYGVARPDVAAVYGAQYLNTGYTFTKAGLTPGSYYLQVHAHSTINGAWYQWGHFLTVQAGPEHTLELPVPSGLVSSPATVSGWAIDASAPSGTGVNLVGGWTYPRPGSGLAPVAIGSGTATYGGNRPAVAASHGERFRYSGYTITGSMLAGPHFIGASAQSSHTQVWTVRTRTIYVDTPTVPLTIDRPGTGTGGVTATGLTCVGGSTTQAVPCGATYPLHTVVTLTAAADPNSTFAGWGGACTGTGTCQVTLSQARFVTANFTKLPDTIALRYYHTDPIGSVRAITDEVGGVVARNDYRPFGEDVAPLTGDPNRFAGKQLDPETALHYFDARYYRQTWGRFTQVDPLHVGAAMTEPQRWNRYAYAGNNPLKYVDPTGLAYMICSKGTGWTCQPHYIPYSELEAWVASDGWGISGGPFEGSFRDGQGYDVGDYYYFCAPGSCELGLMGPPPQPGPRPGPTNPPGPPPSPPNPCEVSPSSCPVPTPTPDPKPDPNPGPGPKPESGPPMKPCSAPRFPPGHSVDINIAHIRSIRDSGGRLTATRYATNAVWNRSIWDYKRYNPAGSYEDAGNFNYGAVMGAAGVSYVIVKLGAAGAQMLFGGGPTLFGLPLPMDNPGDGQMVDAGFTYQLICQ